MSEADEVAMSLLKIAPVLRTLDEARIFVRMHVDVSPIMVDNIAEALLEIQS